MKKYWKSKKYKRYQAKKYRKFLKKSRKSKRKKTSSKAQFSRKHKISVKKQRETILVPEQFSLTKNVDAMQKFFMKIQDVIDKNKKIFFDLSKVKVITPDAILYILSIMENLTIKRDYCEFSGNAPKDPKCRELFIESGFYNYVTSRLRIPEPNKNIISIKTGVNADPILADEIVQFSSQNLNIKDISYAKKIYRIIIECMSNTREHAYSPGNYYDSKWRIIAVYFPDEKRINFVFLDNGKGIVKTVGKKLFERISSSDCTILKDAFEGERRSSTKQIYRGLGLPKIYEIYKNKIIDNLIIISNKAFLYYPKEMQGRDLNHHFSGTLLTWDFVLH